MPSYRCGDCGINYPAGYTYNKCPVHGTGTTWVGDNADEDWEVQMLQLQADAFPGPQGDEIPCVDTKVSLRDDGGYYVSSWDMHRALKPYKTPLPQLTLFAVGKQVFETLQYLHDTRQYKVRPFPTTLSEEDLARLAGG